MWQQKGNGLQYYVKREGDCASYRVQNGDTVSITHAGFVTEGGVVRQFDGNVEDELFKVTIGEGRLIFGMEHGMIGQCLEETRVVKMPARLAFDDPNKRFSNPPVPRGTTVNYQITIHEVLRPGTLQYYWVALVKQGGVPGLFFLLLLLLALYCMYDAHAKKQRRGKKKK